MKDCKPCDDGNGYDGIENGLKSLLNAQLLLGKEVLKLAGSATGALGALRGMKMPRMHGCCDMPEPCWMPLSLGEVKCTLKPGDSGTLCLVVTNGDFRPHDVQFAATGKSASAVSFSTTSATLGPKERIAVTATFTVPKEQRTEDCRCIDHEALVWVRGCRNHYLRWTIDESACAKPCCEEIMVNDDPDYVLHWYDHFYLARPCFGPLAGAGTPGTVVGGPQ
jgi:hypothetical protein